MSGQDWHCSVCTIKKASSFCYCGGRETFLCEQCFIAHYQKAPFQVHIAVPISAYGQHKIPGYFERLQTRSMNIPPAREELLKNLTKIDECIACVEEAIEKIIAAANAYKASILGELRYQRQELEQYFNDAISEVEGTMHEDAPALRSKLAKDLRMCQQDLTVFNYFTFHVDSSKVISAIESICDFMFSPQKFVLPGIKNNTLWLYDVENSKSESLTLSRPFSNGIRLCFIDEEKILVVGSSPASANAFFITLSDAKIAEIQPMQTSRRLPGLIKVGEVAYVFGGDCVQCEMLNILEKHWLQLPDLQNIWVCLTPVLKNNKIYLIKKPIEVFNIFSKTFQQFEVNLTGIRTDNFCFDVSGEIIIIFSGNEIGRWKYGSSSIALTTYTQQKEYPISQCLPLLFGKKAFFVSWDTARLSYFDLENNTCSR